MANGNNKHNKNAEDAVAFSNIFDFEDPMTGEKYTKRKEPVVSTTHTRQGKSVDSIVPDQQNRGWMQGWEKARKRVATSPVSFHTDELEPMLKGICNGANSLDQPFRDKKGDLFGGEGLSRKGPQYGLPLDVRIRTLLGDVKRGDDIVDCYVRGLETPTRRKTYALQQPPGRSYGKGGRYATPDLNKGPGGTPYGGTGYPTDERKSSRSESERYQPWMEKGRAAGFVESQTFEEAKSKGQIYQDEQGSFWVKPGMNKIRI